MYVLKAMLSKFSASAVTFSRFIPVVKARFDYGAMIFVLTFSLVSVSGYRVEKLLNMAHERLSTIIIGTCLCILTTMLVFPVWAGAELHSLITRNMTKLSSSLDSKNTGLYIYTYIIMACYGQKFLSLWFSDISEFFYFCRLCC